MTPTAAQRVALTTARDSAWIRSIGKAVADRLHREVAAFKHHPELIDASSSSSTDNIDLFLSMLAERRPVDRAEPGARARGYVRFLVERKISADDLAAAYRIGVSTFWTGWIERLQHQTTVEEYANALAESTQYILAWSNAMTDRVVEIHAEERALFNRDPEALRLETVAAILDGQPIELERAEQRLRYVLDRPHRCLVVWAGEPAVDLRPSRLHETAPELFGTPLGPAHVALPLGPVTAVWWSPGAGRDPSLDATLGPHLSGSLGTTQPGVQGFRRTYEEAMQARRVATLLDTEKGAMTRYEDVALRSLASTDLEQAGRFVTAQLGALASEEPSVRELADTLRVYLSQGSNLRATASALGVHHNTVGNRLRRAEQLLDRPTLGKTAAIAVALELLAIVRPSQART